MAKTARKAASKKVGKTAAAKAAAEFKAPATEAKKTKDGLPTLGELQTQFNDLVPEANRLGITAKIHTSMFETKAGGMIQIDKLRAKIKEASKKAA